MELVNEKIKDTVQDVKGLILSALLLDTIFYIFPEYSTADELHLHLYELIANMRNSTGTKLDEDIAKSLSRLVSGTQEK